MPRALLSSLLGVVVFSLFASSAIAGDSLDSVRASAADRTETSMRVHKGDRISISARGSWQMGAFIGGCGPDGFNSDVYSNYCLISSANHGALIVRCGSGRWQAVGSSRTITADADGAIELGANDTERGNNSGSLSVSARITPVDSALTSKTTGGQVTVPADSSATRSGIVVRAGQIVRIKASGNWKMGSFIGACDADGMTFAGDVDFNRLRGTKHGTLLVMVEGDDGWYACGSDIQFKADVSGELIFAPNDREVGNNSGSLNVRISVE